MKFLLSLAFILSNFAALASLAELRSLFAVANVNEAANKRLIELTKSAKLKTNPIEYAYHGAGLMAMANHVYWPGTKLEYFDKGKVKLEKAINFDLKNVELRFIRYSIQNNAPAMLGYYDDIEADRLFILEHINATNWSDEYKQEVRSFLNE